MPGPVRKRTWKEHKQFWSSCTKCDLCHNRSNVVLCRGQLPCDVLFVGEAPGTSEDVLGRPFVGQAGKLLDDIIESSNRLQLRLAFTNLVACIPTGEKYGTTRAPTKEEIQSCEPRLKEIIRIANPKTIILVGKLVDKYVLSSTMENTGVHYFKLLHPAAVLQADESQKGLAIQKMRIILMDAFHVTETLLLAEQTKVV